MGALTESLRFYLWLFLDLRLGALLLYELSAVFYRNFVFDQLFSSFGRKPSAASFFYTHKRSLKVRVPMIFFSLSPTPPSVSLNRESSV